MTFSLPLLKLQTAFTLCVFAVPLHHLEYCKVDEERSRIKISAPNASNHLSDGQDILENNSQLAQLVAFILGAEWSFVPKYGEEKQILLRAQPSVVVDMMRSKFLVHQGSVIDRHWSKSTVSRLKLNK